MERTEGEEIQRQIIQNESMLSKEICIAHHGSVTHTREFATQLALFISLGILNQRLSIRQRVKSEASRQISQIKLLT